MKQKGRLFFGCVLCAALVTLGFLLNVDRDEVIAAAEESHVPPVKEVFSSKPDVAFVGDDFSLPSVDNDKPVYDKYTTRQRQEKGLPTTYGGTRDYYYGDNVVYLTFDDGPTPGITDQVLDVLKENDIVASFFLIGQKITEQSEYLIRRAYDMGCSIENHSKTHPGMPELNDREILDEVSYTTEQIVRITGEKPEFFRPPYISYNQKMYDLIDLTFICGYGCEDWEPSVTAKERADRILRDAKPGFIILLHDMEGNTQTVEAIKTIIPALKEQGYEFVTVRDLFRKSGIVPQRNVIYMGADEVRNNYE